MQGCPSCTVIFDNTNMRSQVSLEVCSPRWGHQSLNKGLFYLSSQCSDIFFFTSMTKRWALQKESKTPILRPYPIPCFPNLILKLLTIRRMLLFPEYNALFAYMRSSALLLDLKMELKEGFKVHTEKVFIAPLLVLRSVLSFRHYRYLEYSFSFYTKVLRQWGRLDKAPSFQRLETTPSKWIMTLLLQSFSSLV